MDEKEILEGNKLIAQFMGYIYCEENVMYDTCEYLFYKDMRPITIYSKTPILISERDEDGIADLQYLPNPDYGNKDSKRFRNDLKLLCWDVLNREYITDLKYHQSWDWLIPVILKLGGVMYNGDGWGNSYSLGELILKLSKYNPQYKIVNDIESLWESVVGLIKHVDNVKNEK